MSRIDDAYLLDYASGSAPLAIKILTACQSEIRADTSERLKLVEGAMAAMFENGDVATLSRGSLDSVLQRIDSDEGLDEPEWVQGTLNPDAEVPSALRAFVKSDLDALSWKKILGGPDELPLPELSGEGIETCLLKLRPGMKIPDHDHSQEELTLVLRGGFKDGHGHFVRGDVCTAGPGHMHHPYVDDDEACICLSVSFGVLKFRNPVHRVIRGLSRLTRRGQ